MLPLIVNKRLNALSSNELAFKNAAPLFQDALNKAGCKHELKYEKVDLHQFNKKKKSCPQHNRIYWFNPPAV